VESTITDYAAASEVESSTGVKLKSTPLAAWQQ
jgi:hypothetical protein